MEHKQILRVYQAVNQKATLNLIIYLLEKHINTCKNKIITEKPTSIKHKNRELNAIIKITFFGPSY